MKRLQREQGSGVIRDWLQEMRSLQVRGTNSLESLRVLKGFRERVILRPEKWDL